jgi:hypothetical protein
MGSQKTALSLSAPELGEHASRSQSAHSLLPVSSFSWSFPLRLQKTVPFSFNCFLQKHALICQDRLGTNVKGKQCQQKDRLCVHTHPKSAL